MVAKRVNKAINDIIEREIKKATKEAEEAEIIGALLTCQAIIKHIISYGIDEEDQLRVFIDDAENVSVDLHVNVALLLETTTLNFCL